MAAVVAGSTRSADDGGLRLASLSESPGAAALRDPDTEHVVWRDVRSVDAIRPLPQDAKDDRPSFYDDGSGCQVPNGDPVPKVCASGDEKSDRTLMLVGDSKIAQWQTAFADLGDRQHWRLLTSTKSACPFTDVALTGDRQVRTDCREWGRAALRDVLRLRPDVVVTSQRFDTALPPGQTDGADRTEAAMIDGLQSYWRQIQDAGIPVVVLLDNPSPTTNPVYQCVEDHPTDLGRCAFPLDRGVAGSAAPVLRRAAAGVPGVEVIDMTPTICPDDGWCPAVIGNVLVYRAGSHLTRSYLVSAEPQLADALSRATDAEFGSP